MKTNNLVGRKVLLIQHLGKNQKEIAGGTLNYLGNDTWNRPICIIDRCPFHIDDSYDVIEHPGYLVRDPEDDRKWKIIK